MLPPKTWSGCRRGRAFLYSRPNPAQLHAKPRGVPRLIDYSDCCSCGGALKGTGTPTICETCIAEMFGSISLLPKVNIAKSTLPTARKVGQNWHSHCCSPCGGYTTRIRTTLLDV